MGLELCLLVLIVAAGSVVVFRSPDLSSLLQKIGVIFLVQLATMSSDGFGAIIALSTVLLMVVCAMRALAMIIKSPQSI